MRNFQEVSWAEISKYQAQNNDICIAISEVNDWQRVYSTHLTRTTLFAIKGSNNKKQTKQRKRSEINRCKISQTQQDNTI